MEDSKNDSGVQDNDLRKSLEEIKSMITDLTVHSITSDNISENQKDKIKFLNVLSYGILANAKFKAHVDERVIMEIVALINYAAKLALTAGEIDYVNTRFKKYEIF